MMANMSTIRELYAAYALKQVEKMVTVPFQNVCIVPTEFSALNSSLNIYCFLWYSAVMNTI